MISLRHAGTIAGWEWRTIVRRREFVIATISVPLLGALAVCVVTLSTLSTAHNIRGSEAGVVRVGLVDSSGTLHIPASGKIDSGLEWVRVSTRQQGQQAVSRGRLTELVVVDRDYLRTGATTVFRHKTPSLFDQPQDNYSAVASLRSALLSGREAPDIVERVEHPQAGPISTFEWNAVRRRFEVPGKDDTMARFAVAYAFSMLLLISILSCTAYLLSGIAEEKESRMMEILLASVTHQELLLGKLIGSGAAGLTQLTVWGLMGTAPAIVGLATVSRFVHISGGLVALAGILYVLGFAFYGTLIAAIGSLGTSWKESQQITGLIMIMNMIPLMIMPMLLDQPNGVVARCLSWFPPSAPVTLMLRCSAGSIAPWDLGLSIALLLAATAAVQTTAAKIFRVGLLLQGKPPTVTEVVRWLREA